MNRYRLSLGSLALLVAAPAMAQDAPAADAPASDALGVTLAAVLLSQTGDWTGKLEYRDYQADTWFGLPMMLAVRDGGDGVTQIRTADFDDGPETGIVRITTVTMLGADGASEHTASFRKGRVPEMTSARLTVASAKDAANWTLVAEEDGKDANRPAIIRLTTVREGDTMTTLKEVDFTDDAGEAWLVRNRTTLMRVPEAK